MRRRYKKRNIFLTVILFGGVPVLLLFLFIKADLFNIKNVEIISNGLDCVNNQQIEKILQIQGKNLLTLNTQDLIEDIKNKFFCIKEGNFSKIPPNKIKLELKSREALAKLFSEKTMDASTSSLLESMATPSAAADIESYLVDDEGVIFRKDGNSHNFPTIFIYSQELFLGKRLDDSTKNSLKVLEKLRLFRQDVKSSRILDNFFIVYGKPRIIFRLDRGIDTQIASLQLILEKAKIDSEELEFIDLRFDKPIILIAPKKNG